MKQIIIRLSVLFCIMPILLIVVMGALQGVWFDIEEFYQRPEYAEMYMWKKWQYWVFYIVLALISLFEFLLIYSYTKKGKSNYKYAIVGIALLIWCSISVFFILGTGFTPIRFEV